MVTVMGPSMARYRAISGFYRRCHQVLPALCPLLSAYGYLYLSPFLPHPSISACSLDPMPTQVSALPSLCSLSGSMMKSWIHATFLCALDWHLCALTFPWYG